MFTGIIEGLGRITRIESAGQGKWITLTADFVLEDARIGDSIAINGACLTVVSIKGNRFTADVAPETISKTTFARAAVGECVNLERALRLSDRLGGHLVSGHIDGVGRILSRKKADNAVIVSVGVEPALLMHIIPKGSVAVDGISLTVNTVSQNSFEVSVIPHTAQMTTIGFKREREAVNIETDMIGKYVERFLEARAPAKEPNRASGPDLNLEVLGKSGFL